MRLGRAPDAPREADALGRRARLGRGRQRERALEESERVAIASVSNRELARTVEQLEGALGGAGLRVVVCELAREPIEIVRA